MTTRPELFENNRAWAEKITRDQPGFFEALAKKQTPRYLWIGCADSRVPAAQVCGLQPGEIFVHRNVANLALHTDFSWLSVLQYAVQVLKVTDIIVCGHYGCGGVNAALNNQPHGLIDNWLRHIKDAAANSIEELSALDEQARFDRMCELNVGQQFANVCHTTIVQDAWSQGQTLSVHGWIYGLADGLLKDLGLCANSLDQLPAIYKMAD